MLKIVYHVVILCSKNSSFMLQFYYYTHKETLTKDILVDSALTGVFLDNPFLVFHEKKVNVYFLHKITDLP